MPNSALATTRDATLAAWAIRRPAVAHTQRPANLSGLGRVLVDYYPLRNHPDEQAEDTIAILRAFSLADVSAPAIRAVCDRARRGTSTLSAVARRLWAAVHDGCSFVFDEQVAPELEATGPGPVHEVCLRPVDMLRARRGDCDDFSCLLACLLTAAAVPNGFVTVAADSSMPADYSHVYNVAYVEDGRLPLDASFGRVAGWEPRNRFGKRREWAVWGVKN